MSSSLKPQTTLICTLGGQPQIVTLTLDLLLARGEAIEQVIVVYMASNPRYYQAYQRLTGEFSGDRYADRPCRLRSVPIRLGEDAIAEARSPAEVNAVWQTFYRLFHELKAESQHIHLSLTGGRRILALLAASVAMLHFYPTDRVWHLYTPPDLTDQARDGAMMHAPPDAGVHLIEVPLMPWGAYFPGVRPLLDLSPQAMRSLQAGWLDDAERERCQAVWQMLTDRQRDTLRFLAQGLGRKEAAARLGVGVATVDTHRKGILHACRQVWGEQEWIDNQFLQQRFGPFLASEAPV